MRSACVMLLLAFVASSATAITFTVNTETDAADATPGDGLCRTSAGACSLRAAIQEANATSGFDTVLVPEGSYPLVLLNGAGDDSGASGDLDIREPMALLGTAPPGSVLGVQISNKVFTFGPNYDRVIDIDTADAQTPVRIEHVTISFGSTGEPLGGAGILLRAGSAMTLRDVVLYANSGGSVGGAMALYGKASVRDLRVVDNHISFPVLTPNMIGTVYVGGDGQLDGENVVIDSNSAELGGALAATDNASVTLRQTSIDGATAGNRGGSGPDAGTGGGLYLAGHARVMLENSTLADLYGVTDDDSFNGIVVRDDAMLSLRHASVQSWPIATQGSGSASIHLADSVLFARAGSPQSCTGRLISEGGNWLGSTVACTLATTATDHVGNALEAQVAALSVAVPGGVGVNHFGLPHAILQPTDGSGVDQASAATCPDIDLVGAPRPSPSGPGRPRACDAGAIEFPLDHLFVDGWDDPTP